LRRAEDAHRAKADRAGSADRHIVNQGRATLALADDRAGADHELIAALEIRQRPISVMVSAERRDDAVRGETVRADVGETIAWSFAERDVTKPLAVALDRDMDDIVAIGKELERAENAFGASVDGAESEKKRSEAHGFPVRHEIASHRARFWRRACPLAMRLRSARVGRIRYKDNSGHQRRRQSKGDAGISAYSAAPMIAPINLA
jgi:hypothetical protein